MKTEISIVFNNVEVIGEKVEFPGMVGKLAKPDCRKLRNGWEVKNQRQ